MKPDLKPLNEEVVGILESRDDLQKQIDELNFHLNQVRNKCWARGHVFVILGEEEDAHIKFLIAEEQRDDNWGVGFGGSRYGSPIRSIWQCKECGEKFRFTQEEEFGLREKLKNKGPNDYPRLEKE